MGYGPFFSLQDGNISMEMLNDLFFPYGSSTTAVAIAAGPKTVGNPTNLRDGMALNFKLKQDATGSRTLAYASKYKFPGGTAPTLTTTASRTDLLCCLYDSTDDVLMCNLLKDVR